MKNMLMGIGIGIAGTALFGLGWFSHNSAGNAPASSTSSSNAPITSSAPPNTAPNTPPPATNPEAVTQSDFQQFRATREAALRANPDLAAEYKRIIKALQDEQDQLDAAMIKADPMVAPVVAKLVVLRQQNGAHPPAAVSGPR